MKALNPNMSALDCEARAAEHMAQASAPNNRQATSVAAANYWMLASILRQLQGRAI